MYSLNSSNKDPLLLEYLTMTGKKDCQKVIAWDLIETSPGLLRRVAPRLNIKWILQQ